MYEGLEKLAASAYLEEKKRESLHRILGYGDNERIPDSVFQSILKAKNGEKVHGVQVTDQLKAAVQEALESRTDTPRYGAGRRLGLGPNRRTRPGLGLGIGGGRFRR